MEHLVHAIPIGAGATALIDLWALARNRLFGIATPNYGFVGRWLAWLPRGRFRHDPIAATPPVANELLLGWAAHYAIGIAFAAVLLAVWGGDWVRHPSLGPALVVGIASVAAPYFLMQPGMGLGIAASRAPRPNAARLQSLATHAVFGAGLYAAARVLNFAILGE